MNRFGSAYKIFIAIIKRIWGHFLVTEIPGKFVSLGMGAMFLMRCFNLNYA